MSVRIPRASGVLLLGAISLAMLSAPSLEAGGDKNPAATPAPRQNKGGVPDAGWMKRHDGFVAIAKKGDVDLLFLGDSITDGWRNGAAKKVWDKSFGSMKPANFGIGGDRTEHVLWRISNGELDGIKPKVAVIMIGTNNSGANSAEQIAGGITAIVKKINDTTPNTRILLLGVFPRSEKADAPVRSKIAKINEIISKLDDNKRVKYLDIGSKFLKDGGALTKDIMPDYLHLSADGYQIWADAITPTLSKLIKN